VAAALQPQPRHPVRAGPQVLHATGVRAEVGPDAIERALHPGVHVERVQVVQEQQALHQRVGQQPVADRLAGRALGREGVHDVAEPVSVEAEQQPHQFLRRGRGAAAGGPQGGEQFLDPFPGLPYTGHPLRLSSAGYRRAAWRRDATAGQVARMAVIGECTFSSTLPLPRYMCTPHGRHGSKLRTARMMSIPLNWSGGFSSKIGVFCTASS